MALSAAGTWRCAEASVKINVPNPHGSVLSGPLIERLIQRAGISSKEWENLGR